MDPLTMMIISALGSTIGLAGSARQNKKNDRYLQGMVNSNEAEYNKDYNTNYLDTEEAKAAIRTMLEQMRQVNSDSKSSAAITGASAEKQVAQQGEMNKAFSGSLTNLAGKGTARKEMIKDRYLNRKAQLDSMVMGNMKDKSQNWNQFGSNAMQLGMTGLLANQGGTGVDQSFLEKIQALLGNSSGKTSPTDFTNLSSLLLGSSYSKPKAINYSHF